MKKIKENKFVILFFLILFIIGVLIFKDYGITGDEVMQRNHALVSYRQYVELTKPFVGENYLSDNFRAAIKSWFIEPKIKLYSYKYYGVGIQLPLALLEAIPDFTLDIATVFYARHLYIYLIFLISLVYFYRILNEFILKEKKYSLLGTLFLFLSPRIFGDAFYNIKDLVFMSLTIINCYYAICFFENDDIKTIIKLSLITALTINSRIVGLLVIFLAIVFKILYGNQKIKTIIFSILKVILFTWIFYFLMTPASWEHPLLFPFETLDFFFNYQDPLSKKIQVCWYFGKYLQSTDLPWHYPLVWIFISTPVIYTLLFIVGSLKNLIKLIKNRFKKINVSLFYLNSILFIMLLFVCIIKPVLYGGWRHLYFIYPIIVINSIIGFEFLARKFKKSSFIILFVNLFFVVSWMTFNHPYENEYFNLLVRDYAVKNFEINYSRLANTEALRFIAKYDDRKKITVLSSYNIVSNLILKKEDRDRMILNHSDYNSDYIISSDIYGDPKLEKKCKVIKIKKIDGVRLYTIYKNE